MTKEPTNMEILEALNIFSSKIDKRIDDLEKNLNQKIDDFRAEVNQKFIEIDQRLDYHETWLNRIERNMVRKDDFNSLINLFKNKELISDYESTRFLYPKIVN